MKFYDQIGISTTAVLSLPPDGRKRERKFRAALDFEGSEAERERGRERDPLKRSKSYNAAVCSQHHSCLHKTDQSVSYRGPRMDVHS